MSIAQAWAPERNQWGALRPNNAFEAVMARKGRQAGSLNSARTFGGGGGCAEVSRVDSFPTRESCRESSWSYYCHSDFYVILANLATNRENVVQTLQAVIICLMT